MQVGVPTGIMDQSAVLLCRAGHALLLDCCSGESDNVPLNPAAAGLALLIIDTRAKHRLTESGYAARHIECEEAARALGMTFGQVLRLIVLPQAMRAMVAADFCNGKAAVLDFRHWTFLNADLTVNFAREPVGEWILLDAESWIGPDGAGLSMARLADSRGYFGRAIQSLVIERR